MAQIPLQVLWICREAERQRVRADTHHYRTYWFVCTLRVRIFALTSSEEQTLTGWIFIRSACACVSECRCVLWVSLYVPAKLEKVCKADGGGLTCKAALTWRPAVGRLTGKSGKILGWKDSAGDLAKILWFLGDWVLFMLLHRNSPSYSQDYGLFWHLLYSPLLIDRHGWNGATSKGGR